MTDSYTPPETHTDSSSGCEHQAHKRIRLDDEETCDTTALSPPCASSSSLERLSDEQGDHIMSSYSGMFGDNTGLQPIQYLAQIHSYVEEDHPIPVEVLHNLQSALDTHISKTQDDGLEHWQAGYTNAEPFYLALLQVITDFSELDYTSHDRAPTTIAESPAGISILAIMESFAKLSTRIAMILPAILRLSRLRRDSVFADAKGEVENVPWFGYLELFHNLLTNDKTRCHRFITQDLGLRSEDIAQKLVLSSSSQASSTSPFLALTRILLDSTEHTTINWSTVLNVMNIVRRTSSDMTADFDQLISIIDNIALPAIQTLSSDTLTEQEHERLVNFSMKCIAERVKNANATLQDLYHAYGFLIRQECEPVFPERENETSETFWGTAGQHPECIPEIILVAWSLRASKFYIASQHIGVCQLGLQILNSVLVRIYAHRNRSSSTHPVLQIATRFLKQNDIISCIVSHEPHIATLRHVQETLAFSACMGIYDVTDTGQIWTACVAGNNATLSSAAFDLLDSITDGLSIDHIKAIVRKYEDSPPMQWSQSAVRCFRRVLTRWETLITQTMHFESRVAFATSIMQLIDYFASVEKSMYITQMYTAAIAHVDMLKDTGFLMRQAMLENCLTRAIAKNSVATCASTLYIQIISQLPTVEFLPRLYEYPESEMADFLARILDFQASESALMSPLKKFAADIELVYLFLSHSSPAHHLRLEKGLCDSILLARQISYQHRELAWATLQNVARRFNTLEMQRVVDRIIATWTNCASFELATCSLVAILQNKLRIILDNKLGSGDWMQFPTEPEWKILIRIAVSAAPPSTTTRAIRAICDLIMRESRADTYAQAYRGLQSTLTLSLVHDICSRSSKRSRPTGRATTEKTMLLLHNLLDLDTLRRLECEISDSKTVRRTLTENYDKLHELALHHRSTAELVLPLLIKLDPSDLAIARITSDLHPNSSMFPADVPCRLEYSMSILWHHITRCDTLLSKDPEFICSGLSMCVSLLLGERVVLEGCVLKHTLCCTVSLLRIYKSSTFSDIRQRLMGHDRAKEQVPIEDGGLDKALSALILSITKSLTNANGLDREIGRDSLLRKYELLLIWDGCAATAGALFNATDENVRLHTNLLFAVDEQLASDVAFLVMEHCTASSPGARSHLILANLLQSLNRAFEHPYTSRCYFSLIKDLLRHQPKGLQEGCLQSLAQRIIALLLSYRHRETLKDTNKDEAVHGALSVVAEAVRLLRLCRTPLDFTISVPILFQKLLFPIVEDTSRWPVLHKESRDLLFAIIQSTCKHDTDFARLLQYACDASTVFARSNDMTMVPSVSLRQLGSHAGLTNLGMTCYMNSLLQQLFANLHFRDFVFNLNLPMGQEDTVWWQLQYLFVKMQESPCQVVDTASLAQALDVATDQQEDVHSFYAILLDTLEESLPDAQKKREFAEIFGGEFLSQVRGDCEHTSTRFERFYDIAITVKDKADVYESLSEYVDGEYMEGSNRYRCMTCAPGDNGRLVNAMTRTCLTRVPDHITLCLKRFTWDMTTCRHEKVNDKFQFPAQINLAPFTKEALEGTGDLIKDDIFELVGVIVHCGIPSSGHYWSYIRSPINEQPDDSYWTLLDDQHAKSVVDGFSSVSAACSGGGTTFHGEANSDNAYVLFYQRARSIHEQQELIEKDRRTSERKPWPCPAVRLSLDLEERVAGENARQLALSHLLDASFLQFATWILDHHARTDAVNADLPGPSGSSFMTISNCAKLASVIMLRIIRHEGAESDSLQKFVAAAIHWCDLSEDQAAAFINDIILDEEGCDDVWSSDNIWAQAALTEAILTGLKRLRCGQDSRYNDIASRLIKSLSQLYPSRIFGRALAWEAYFELITQIANFGAQETAMVFNDFEISHVVRLMIMVMNEDREALSELYGSSSSQWAKMPVNFLFEFLDGLFSLRVEWDGRCSPPEERRRIEADKVLLRAEDWDLMFTKLDNGRSVIAAVATAHTRTTNDWYDFKPGRFVGRLVAAKAYDRDERDAMLLTIQMALKAEERELTGHLHLVLHCCAQLGDGDESRILLSSVAQALEPWRGVHNDIDDFLQALLYIVPTLVYRTMSTWTLMILEHKDGKMRAAMLKFMNREILHRSIRPQPSTLHVGSVRHLMNNLYHKLGALGPLAAPERCREDMEGALRLSADWFSWLNEELCGGQWIAADATSPLAREVASSRGEVRSAQSLLLSSRERTSERPECRTGSMFISYDLDEEHESLTDNLVTESSDSESSSMYIPLLKFK